MTTAYDGGHVPEIGLRHRLMISRMEQGLSQAALAQAIGISRTSVSNAESGTTVPRRIVVNAWALATGVPVTWLLTGEDPWPADPDGGATTDAPNDGSTDYKSVGTSSNVRQLWMDLTTDFDSAAAA